MIDVGVGVRASAGALDPVEFLAEELSGGTNGVFAIGALCLDCEDVAAVFVFSPDVAARATVGVLDGVGDALDAGPLGADDAACSEVVGRSEFRDECGVAVVRVAVVRGHSCDWSVLN